MKTDMIDILCNRYLNYGLHDIFRHLNDIIYNFLQARRKLATDSGQVLLR